VAGNPSKTEVRGVVCRAVYSNKMSVLTSVGLKDFETHLRSCLPLGSGLVARLVDDSVVDYDAGDGVGTGKDEIVEYDMLLGFSEPRSFVEIDEYFARLVDLVGGELVGTAMDKSVDGTRWFLGVQFGEFEKPVMGSAGEVVVATGEVVWHRPAKKIGELF